MRACLKLVAVEEKRLYPTEPAQTNCKAEFDSKVAGLSDKLAINVVRSDRGAV